MQKFLRCLFFILFLALRLKAADIKSIGVPYIQNFSKAIYASGNQNWSISKDKNGVMYIGNAEGLLTYDGKYWDKYRMPNGQIVRSVAADGNGKIYTGCFGDFGYWSYKKNKLTYTSLTHLLPKSEQLNDEIWKIHIFGRKVIFQSFKAIYFLENGKISILKNKGNFLFSYKIGNRLFVEDKGLYELKSGKLEFIPGSDVVCKTGVLSILPFKGDKLLIGTGKNGLFIYDGKAFIQFNTPANSFLSAFQLNNGTKILGKYYAYGTILNGIIIIDENGNIIQRINKSSGLQNNTVLSLYSDDEQNLWAGLDNGIDRIELNSPLYFYLDKTGVFGTVYSSVIFNNKIYLGTNQGLFYSDWRDGTQFSNLNFKLIPNSQGQVWELTVIDNQLLCGHNNGTFNVVGDKIESLTNYSGGWTIKKLNSNPNLLIQGTYTGLLLFKKNTAGKWEFYKKIANFNVPSRYVEQDNKGEIWVSHAYKGLYKLKLSADYSTVVSNKYYDKKSGLPTNYNLNLFNLENQIVFASDAGFFTYDNLSDKFSKYNVLNRALGSFSSSNKIINAGSKKYWFINHGKTALADFNVPGKLAIDSNQFSILDGKMVQYYENISRISDSIYLISVDDGFVFYNAGQKIKSQPIKIQTNVLIRRIEDITDKYFIISENGNDGSEIEIKNSRNNIRISYSLPYYRQSKIKFQYYLEGYSKDWSDWSSATQKDFTNLSSGKYIFKVRAKINDSTVSEITTFEFRILRPWYLNNWAILFYVIVIAIALILGKKIYERKLQKDSQKISDRLQAEQDEILRQESEANEKQIHKLQTEKLQAELASKNRELANSAMTLVYKNELLQKLSEEILKLKDENGKKLADEQVRRIQKVINDGMNDERDWNLFENSFNEAHESFFKKLKVGHPDLVPNDLKLCAYLRMNMSSKEMSSLLNITLRGVEIRRYRLRKKLNVPHDKNLTEFLMEL
ncbi:triple tyrosine motif-containing protein [Pedobacter sp. Leaf176]|uniref:ligand-binding sensor domain-containing protein n=1 Tax=Pedobacter sp. Leaf176 TaxID=1736286 RepID=UPI0006FCEA77|nr:triple tyrosine motif-containing protein [Pedobacter sp. Leaf176]KQR68157.1 transcriptional regulator [Pedobacter sp. Leaf176]